MCRAAAQTRPVGKQSPRAAPRTAPRSRLCGGRSCVSGSQDWAAEDFKVMPRPASKLAAEHGVEPGSPYSQSGATASLLASRKGVRALHEGSGSRRGGGRGGGGLHMWLPRLPLKAWASQPVWAGFRSGLCPRHLSL